jgi:hypothetical protein
VTAQHLEVLVEEPSTEAFLRELLPRLLPGDRTFRVLPFQGKADLLGKLQDRLRGYASWLPETTRVLVVVDRDDDDCRKLKRKLDTMAAAAGLRTRSTAAGRPWQVVNRIAIEELEAWYFGDWQAVCEAYPGVSATITNKRGFRDPDAISGGTWEQFERVLQRHGHFRHGLRKIEAARAIGARLNPERNTSNSFGQFCAAILEATT